MQTIIFIHYHTLYKKNIADRAVYIPTSRQIRRTHHQVDYCFQARILKKTIALEQFLSKNYGKQSVLKQQQLEWRIFRLAHRKGVDRYNSKYHRSNDFRFSSIDHSEIELFFFLIWQNCRDLPFGINGINPIICNRKRMNL